MGSQEVRFHTSHMINACWVPWTSNSGSIPRVNGRFFRLEIVRPWPAHPTGPKPGESQRVTKMPAMSLRRESMAYVPALGSHSPPANGRYLKNFEAGRRPGVDLSQAGRRQRIENQSEESQHSVQEHTLHDAKHCGASVTLTLVWSYMQN